MSRPIYGRIYELCLRGQGPDEHSYVGMTTTTIHRRVHGSAGHTSPDSVARDPWKARILPGPAGYRLLETVYSTGDCEENDRALRRAEAFWIDRLRPTENDVRPVRPFGPPQRRAQQARPARPASRPTRRRRRSRVLAVLCLASMLAWVYIVARVVVAMHLPWPAAPWVAAPVLGTVIGWTAFARTHRAVRRIFR
jgi:hypothetical protein